MFHLIHFRTILYILCFTGSAVGYWNKGRGSSSSYNRSAIQQYQAQQQQPKVFQKPTLPQQPQVLQHPTLPQQQPQQSQQYTPEVQDTPQVTDTAQVMEPTEITCVSDDIQVSQEALFSTSRDRSLIYSSVLAPVAPFSMETNPEDPNLSLSEITTPNLSWKGMHHISRPQFRTDDDYEVLSENGDHQILRWIHLPTLASASSFFSPLPEQLQPVEITDYTATVTSTTSSPDTDIS